MDDNKREAAQSLVDALWLVKRAGLGVVPYDGLCAAVRAALGTENWCAAVDLWDSDSAQRAWPEFSGSDVYPVPGRSAAFYAHCAAGTMWVGEYGSARIRLLNWCIRYWEGRLSA